MSRLGKLQKNAQKFKVLDMYKDMTPEKYVALIDSTKKRIEQEVAQNFIKEYDRLVKEYNEKLRINKIEVMNHITVELLYVLADKMYVWEKDVDPDYKQQAVDTVQNILEETFKAIESYVNMKSPNKAYESFKRKKKKLENTFKIKFFKE
ncbi:MAG: hypothetical protein MJ191_00075 [Clostridium sp.]|nr:hypothetical protein [Clostridium sp.]